MLFVNNKTKKNNMKKNITIIIASLVILMSCKKNGDSQQFEKNVVKKDLPSFASLFSYATDNNTSGKFMITTSSVLGNTDLNKFFEININGAFLNKSNQQNEAGQTNYFNSIKVEPNEMKPGQVHGYYKNFNWSEAGELFGTNLNLKLQRGATASFGGDTVVNYNGGYSPKVFICTNNFMENGMASDGEYFSGSKLNPTFTFNWNKDSLNQNGVFVYLEYDPDDFGNQTIKNSFPTRQANGVMVEDNGTYTLTSEMFVDIPLNSRLNVYIGRGNFEYIRQLDGTVTDMQMTVLTYQNGGLFYKTD